MDFRLSQYILTKPVLVCNNFFLLIQSFLAYSLILLRQRIYLRTLRVRAAVYQSFRFFALHKKFLSLGTGQASDLILSVFTWQSPVFLLNRSPPLFCAPYLPNLRNLKRKKSGLLLPKIRKKFAEFLSIEYVFA